MDNERKIMPSNPDSAENTSLVEQAKAFFLRITGDELRSAQVAYNLNEEFAKTKRNRNIFVVAVIVLTSAVFIGLAAFFSISYEKKNNTVQIASSEFDDINLRDLLDKARKLESDLGFTKLQIQTLLDRRDAELSRAASDKDDREMLARSRLLSAEEYAAQKTAIEKQQANRSQSIRDNYAAKIRVLDLKANAYKAELDSFDARKLDLAKQQEVALNNERRLYDKEKDRVQAELETKLAATSADFEARLLQRNQFIGELEKSYSQTLSRELQKQKDLYNPIWDDERAAALLTSPIDENRLAQYRILVNPKYVNDSGISQNSVDSINQGVSDYQFLINRLSRIPFSGSVPGALSQLNYRLLSILDGSSRVYDTLWQQIEKRDSEISDKDNQIGNLKTNSDQATLAVRGLSRSMDSYLKNANMDVVVVENSGGGILLGYSRTGYEVKVGQKFYALKANGELIAEYEVESVDSVVHLRLSTTPGLDLSPQPKPITPKLVFSGKEVQVLDQLVRQDKWLLKNRR